MLASAGLLFVVDSNYKCLKKLWFRQQLTANDTSKTAKITAHRLNVNVLLSNTYIHSLCPKKLWSQTLAVTLSNLNRF